MGKSKQQRKKEKKVVLMFDENERREFLSGFSKRKKERQRKAKEKTLGRLEGQRKKLLDEKRSIMADIVREGGIRLQDPQNLECLEGQSETIDCGEHTVTITEFDDAYGTIRETRSLAEAAEAGDSGDEEVEFADTHALLGDDQPLAGESVGDQRKIRLRQIAQELKGFSVQMQPIKASLNEKAKKQKKRRQKMQERREQEVLRSRSGKGKNLLGVQGKKNKNSMVGIKRKKVNRHIIQD
ncbi:hypothetical protein BIW11_01093 [Tropilaelaps mercedesae]|uniref:Uncharacterized protein n=1 Tax=Tropilaelaps mercedesae TaxID=418985 RepID=A0A1V9XJS5_9ACAR|nr:hypothetical protein BIW11_01093 [Tropilaelaps mercedesae]